MTNGPLRQKIKPLCASKTSRRSASLTPRGSPPEEISGSPQPSPFGLFICVKVGRRTTEAPAPPGQPPPRTRPCGRNVALTRGFTRWSAQTAGSNRHTSDLGAARTGHHRGHEGNRKDDKPTHLTLQLKINSGQSERAPGPSRTPAASAPRTSRRPVPARPDADGGSAGFDTNTAPQREPDRIGLAACDSPALTRRLTGFREYRPRGPHRRTSPVQDTSSRAATTVWHTRTRAA